jgi:TPP-dependent pyruvate/acetoin dehydrogenase alpha subunit
MTVSTLNAVSLVPSDSDYKVRPASIKKFKKDELFEVYRLMNTSRRLDEKMLTLLKQGRGFFTSAAQVMKQFNWQRQQR